jgi:methionyl aminopeptidase
VEILRSPREIAQMRKAGLLVWEAHQLVSAMVRPGVATSELDAVVEGFFKKHNAVPLFKGVHGKVPFPAVTCISINEEVVHGIPGPRRLEEGDIVSIDTGCKLNGWCGDAAATYPVGRISPELQRLLATTRNVLQLAIDQMGKCKRWSEVAKQMELGVKNAGYTYVETFGGHGIGREMWEEPHVPNYFSSDLRRGGDFRLQPGLVIAIEPMVNMGKKQLRTQRDHWTQVTADGKPSAHFEHTVAMTDSGPFVLTSGPNGESW